MMLDRPSRWIGLLLVGVLISSVQPLEARNGENLHFLSLEYGRSYLDELEGTSGSDIFLENGTANRLAWGGQVSSLRVEYGLSRRTSNVKRFKNSSGAETKSSGSFDRTGIYLDFYGYEDFPDLGSDLTNYWGMGMSILRYQLNDFEAPKISVDDTDYALTPGFFVGWEWIVTTRHRLALQYRYSVHSELDFEAQAPGRSLALENFRESTLSLNYRWFY